MTKISDEEFEILAKMAFGPCLGNCKECKYYYAGGKSDCFALDAFMFLKYAVRGNIEIEDNRK